MTTDTTELLAAGGITVWRGGTSQAQYPLCHLEPYVVNGVRDGYRFHTFHGGRRQSRLIDDDAAGELLARHQLRGNRVETHIAWPGTELTMDIETLKEFLGRALAAQRAVDEAIAKEDTCTPPKPKRSSSARSARTAGGSSASPVGKKASGS